MMGGMFDSILSLSTEGNKLCIGVALPQLSSMFGANSLTPFADIIKTIQDDLKVDQNIEFTLRLASSPKDFLTTETSESIAANILKGISVDLKLNVWRKITDILIKLLEVPQELGLS